MANDVLDYVVRHNKSQMNKSYFNVYDVIGNYIEGKVGKLGLNCGVSGNIYNSESCWCVLNL